MIGRRLDSASDHILSFLDARDVPVTGTTTTLTYKSLRDTLDVIVDCGYFSHSANDVDAHATVANGHSVHGGCVLMFHRGLTLHK